MNDSDNSNAPSGAPSAAGARPQDARSLGDHCRRIQHDAQALAIAVQEAADEFERFLTEQVQERPYTTLGVAAGVGYALGGGLRSRLTAMVVGTATRLAMTLAARELVAQLSPGASASVQNKSS